MRANGYNKYAWLYDQSHAHFIEDIAFYKKRLGDRATTVLECGTGSGRILLPLAEAGHQCWGIDTAAAMLELAQGKIGQLDPAAAARIHLLQADMRMFDLGRQFEVIIVPHNTLMHLTASELTPTLGRLRTHLKPPGLVIIDLINPFHLLALDDQSVPKPEATWIDPRDHQKVVQLSQYWLHEGNRLELKWLFTKDEEVVGEISADYTVWLPHELQLALQRSGLALQKMEGSYEGTPFNEQSERLILEATRPD